MEDSDSSGTSPVKARRTPRQWTAYVELELSKGVPHEKVFGDILEAGFDKDEARRMVYGATRRQRKSADILLCIGGALICIGAVSGIVNLIEGSTDGIWGSLILVGMGFLHLMVGLRGRRNLP